MLLLCASSHQRRTQSRWTRIHEIPKGKDQTDTVGQGRPTVRGAVNGILQQVEQPEPNITKEMRDALKSLREDESIMVLPADKGRASVYWHLPN